MGRLIRNGNPTLLPPLRGLSLFTGEAERSRRIGTVPGFREDFALQKGFTIIEIMIVLTIIGILLTIAQPQFRQYTMRAKETVLKENLFTLRDVIDQYYADKGRYPDDLQELVGNGYIRSVPEDPFTRSSETWVTVPPDIEEGGIFDVHSGSDLVALDGTPYNEW